MNSIVKFKLPDVKFVSNYHTIQTRIQTIPYNKVRALADDSGLSYGQVVSRMVLFALENLDTNTINKGVKNER